MPIWIKYEVFKFGKPLFIKDEKKIIELKKITLRDYLDYGKYFEAKIREKAREALKDLRIDM